MYITVGLVRSLATLLRNTHTHIHTQKRRGEERGRKGVVERNEDFKKASAKTSMQFKICSHFDQVIFIQCDAHHTNVYSVTVY